MKKILLAALMAASTLSASADEGMWVLHKIDPRTQQLMQQLGLKLNGQELYDAESGVSLKDAVVDFGDFCSGVVVSPDGLVFTNHHCGFGAIQALSTTEDDILCNGFVARSHAEERPAEGLSVFFLQRTDDVTSRAMALIDSLKAAPAGELGQMDNAQASMLAASTAIQRIEAEYKAANPGREVRVQSFYGGSQYFVSIYKQYTDIRLVFTPTQSLGKFGGDTDNWMWPRQTSDFSVFRIYADKNGEPAPYSPENEPLHPKRWAKVSLDGYAPGDYCMTIGYPGSTDRYLSSYGINDRMENQNKPRIDVRGLKQDVWTKWMKSDRAIGLKYASKFANSSNYWKNSIGMNQALEKLHVVADKQKLEERLKTWIEQNDERKARFANVLPTLKEGYEKGANVMRNYMYLAETLSGIEIVQAARLADNFNLTDEEADTEDAIKAIEEFYKDYDARVDEEATAVLLRNMAEKMDEKYQPAIIAEVREKWDGDFKKYAHHVFANSVLTKERPLAQIALAGKALEDDPATRLATTLRESAMGIVTELRKGYVTTSYNESMLTQALLEMEQDQPHYSDANFSMRLSYGIVQDYTADGQHFDYYTPSASILEKAAKQAENDDYMLEEDIMKLIAKKDFGRYADKRTGDLQLCFLSNNDITGGNSGSPMFNGKGELIGLAFDGNWEAMSGDILFDPALQRCIGVDIRFVLYLIDKWGHADNLIKELGL